MLERLILIYVSDTVLNVQSNSRLPSTLNSLLYLCCNRLTPLNDSKDHKLSDKLLYLVKRLVPSGLIYSSNGKIFSCIYLTLNMTAVFTGHPLCITIAREALIRELKDPKKDKSELMAHILKQKDVLKARKRVSSPSILCSICQSPSFR